MEIPFVKMEGCGNDYVYLDLFPGRNVEGRLPADLADLARRMSDRHFGIGGDGLILIRPSAEADARMQMFNADGSESEMCGNGIRCVAKYVYESGLARRTPMRIETLAGVLTLDLITNGDRVERVRVDMGIPRTERADIPMNGPGGQVIEEVLDVDGTEVRITCVSMGNPHCVIFVPDVDLAPVREIGRKIEIHPAFPSRTNVEFVQILGPGEVRQRTWERGSGETLACGTGASAVCVAGVLAKRTQPSILNHLTGGDLRLEWATGGSVTMEGPAREVFRGVWSLNAGE